jgi:hypothetical protein
MRHSLSLACLLAAFAAGGCTGAEPVAQGPSDPVYQGIETLLLDGDLVNFRVAMTGAEGPTDVEDYGRCAAAQYALIRGAGFARHVRTSVDESGGVWRGDAVYTISAALPLGMRNIDAEVTVRDCAARGIPTI